MPSNGARALGAGDVLSLEVVTVREAENRAGGVLTLDMRLSSGDLHLVFCTSRALTSLLGDTCLGLTPPSSGQVRLFERDWQDLDRGQAHWLRAHVGRVLARGNWLETRSVWENIVLQQLHATQRSATAINREAGRLAREFGLPGLPVDDPEACPPADLERAACARAFMGRPALVILEHPMTLTYPEMLAPLMEAVQRVRNRGGAVLLITSLTGLFDDASIPVTRRHRIAGGLMVTADGDRV